MLLGWEAQIFLSCQTWSQCKQRGSFMCKMEYSEVYDHAGDTTVEGRKHHHCNQLSLGKTSVDHVLYRCGDISYLESVLWDKCIQKTWERIVSGLHSTISAFAVLLGENTSCKERFLTGPSHTSIMCCNSLEQEAQCMEENRQVVKVNI